MRSIRIFVMIMVVVGAVGLNGNTRQDTSGPGTVQISYEEFMKLSSSSRRARFSGANPETKAIIMRTHAERWLAANRGRLTTGQVSLVEQLIALVTPAWYRNPVDPEAKRKFDALEAQLRCRVRRSDLMAAFKPSLDPVPASWLDDLRAWFGDCLLDRVLRQPNTALHPTAAALSLNGRG